MGLRLRLLDVMGEWGRFHTGAVVRRGGLREGCQGARWGEGRCGWGGVMREGSEEGTRETWGSEHRRVKLAVRRR